MQMDREDEEERKEDEQKQKIKECIEFHYSIQNQQSL